MRGVVIIGMIVMCASCRTATEPVAPAPPLAEPEPQPQPQPTQATVEPWWCISSHGGKAGYCDTTQAACVGGRAKLVVALQVPEDSVSQCAPFQEASCFEAKNARDTTRAFCHPTAEICRLHLEHFHYDSVRVISDCQTRAAGSVAAVEPTK